MRKWWRNYMRARQLINPHFAAFAKNRLALIYAFGAWNIFGAVVAMLFKEKVPKTHDSIDYAKVLGIKDATVVRFSNLTKVDEYDIELSDKELEDFTKVVGTKEELQKYEQENLQRVEAAQEAAKNKQITNR